MKRILEYKVTLTWNGDSEPDPVNRELILNDELTPKEVRDVIQDRLTELFEQVPEEPMKVTVELTGDTKEA